MVGGLTNVDENTSLFLAETGYADYRIVSTAGYSDDDVKAIEDLYGDEYVSRYVTFNGVIESTSESDEDTLSITVTENESVSGFVLAEGEPYDASDDEGMWIGEKYAVDFATDARKYFWRYILYSNSHDKQSGKSGV